MCMVVSRLSLMTECYARIVAVVSKTGEHKSMWLFVKEMVVGAYKIFVSSVQNCKAKATENIPIRICGKERAVATIAVYLREKADGVAQFTGRRS